MANKKAFIFVHDISEGAGTELAALKLADILENINIESKIISLADYANSNYLGVSRVKRWSLDLKIIRKIMRDNNDALMIGTTHSINIMITLLGFNRNHRSIVCEHMPYFSKTMIQKLSSRIVYRYADASVFLTQRDADNYKLKKTYVIPNYIEVKDDFHKYDKTDKNINYLIVGRLCYQKGTDLLPEIINELERRKFGYKLRICGTGPMINIIEGLVEVNSKVEYLGQLEHSVTLLQIADSDVILLPSRFEGFPFVMLESLALGKPVVAFDCQTGPSEIITEDSGGLVEYLNIKKFAEFAMRIGFEFKNNRRDLTVKCKKRALLFSKKAIEMQWNIMLKNLY